MPAKRSGGSARKDHLPIIECRDRRALEQQASDYWVDVLPAVGLGHIESNDCPDCELDAADGAAAGGVGAVGGGAGQIDCEGCAACWAGALCAGDGHATCPPCCAAAGGELGQGAAEGCCGGAPFAPMSIRVGEDDGGFSILADRVCGRPTATFGLGFGFSTGAAGAGAL